MIDFNQCLDILDKIKTKDSIALKKIKKIDSYIKKGKIHLKLFDNLDDLLKIFKTDQKNRKYTKKLMKCLASIRKQQNAVSTKMINYTYTPPNNYPQVYPQSNQPNYPINGPQNSPPNYPPPNYPPPNYPPPNYPPPNYPPPNNEPEGEPPRDLINVPMEFDNEGRIMEAYGKSINQIISHFHRGIYFGVHFVQTINNETILKYLKIKVAQQQDGSLVGFSEIPALSKYRFGYEFWINKINDSSIFHYTVFRIS
jgi:hypothetical protein